MLNQLKINRDIAALESEVFSEAANVLKNIIPSLAGGFSAFVNRFNPADAFTMLTPHDKFLRDLPKHTYLDVSPLTAYVPEGMDVTYLEYSTQLLAAAKHASGILDHIMSPYSVFLARLVTNKELQLSTMPLNLEFAKLGKERDALNKYMGECFKPGSSATQRSIGDVVNRNADWSAVFVNMDAMSKLVMHVDRKALNKKVEENSKYLEQLMSKVKHGELNDVSPEVVRSMAEGAFQAASELEFFAATYYRVIAFNNAVNNTLEYFKKVTETTA